MGGSGDGVLEGCSVEGVEVVITIWLSTEEAEESRKDWAVPVGLGEAGGGWVDWGSSGGEMDRRTLAEDLEEAAAVVAARARSISANFACITK